MVIPAYNAEAEIEACVTALRQQSVPSDSFEIIVVDDGSTDDTGSVLSRLPVIVVRQENRGPAAARNAGAAAARGEFIVFVDSDCVPSPDWLEEMLKPFKDEQVVGVSGAYRTEQRSLVARFVQIEFEDRYRMLSRRPYIDMVASHAAAYRREMFLRVGGFLPELRMNEDVELSYRLSSKFGRLVFNPQAIVHHTHPASAARYLSIKFGRGYWRIMVYKLFPQKAVSDTYTPRNLKVQVSSIYLLGLCVALGPIVPEFLLLAAGVFFFSCATMIPMCVHAARSSVGLGLACIPLLWVRALGLASGSAAAGIDIAREALRTWIRRAGNPTDGLP